MTLPSLLQRNREPAISDQIEQVGKSIAKQCEGNTALIAELGVREKALVMELSTLKSARHGLTPLERLRVEKITEEIKQVVGDLGEAKRQGQVLKLERQQLELPGLRADADRLIKEANREIERVFKEPIAKLRAQLLENSAGVTSAIALVERANEAHWRAEQAAGGIPGATCPTDFDRRITMVLRALYVSGASDPRDDFSRRLTAPVPVGADRCYDFSR